MITVKTGIQDNQNIEIISGLDGGEDVIVAPFSAISRRLEDGKIINRVSQDELFKTSAKK